MFFTSSSDCRRRRASSALAKRMRALAVAESSFADEESSRSSSAPGSTESCPAEGGLAPTTTSPGFFLHAKLRQLRDQLLDGIAARIGDVLLDRIGGELLGFVYLALVRFGFADPKNRRNDSRIIRLVFDETAEEFRHLVPFALAFAGACSRRRASSSSLRRS